MSDDWFPTLTEAAEQVVSEFDAMVNERVSLDGVVCPDSGLQAEHCHCPDCQTYVEERYRKLGADQLEALHAQAAVDEDER